MKKIFFLLLLIPSVSFWATTNITCDEVIAQLSWDNIKNYEIFDSNWVKSAYWYDTNKWKSKYWVVWLSNEAMCRYNWKLAKPDFSIDTIWGTSVASQLQYIILEKDWILTYYAERPYTYTLLQDDIEILKSQAKSNTNIQQNINPIGNTSEQSKKETLDDFNKSIEDAKRIIEQKQSIEIPIVSTTNTTKKLSPINKKKAVLIKKKIQLLKKQLEILEKQLESL